MRLENHKLKLNYRTSQMVHDQMCTVPLWEENVVHSISQFFFFPMEHLAVLGFYQLHLEKQGSIGSKY